MRSWFHGGVQMAFKSAERVSFLHRVPAARSCLHHPPLRQLHQPAFGRVSSSLRSTPAAHTPMSFACPTTAWRAAQVGYVVVQGRDLHVAACLPLLPLLLLTTCPYRTSWALSVTAAAGPS